MATPFGIINAQNLMRGDIDKCNEKADWLNLCFAEIKEAPTCSVMGDCIGFQAVDDYCLLTKRVFTVYKDIAPAHRRGETEHPIQSDGTKKCYFEGKPVKKYENFSDFFIVTDEWKDFFNSECPVNQLPVMYQKTVSSIAERMKEATDSVDLSFQYLMWNTLLSATEADEFGDPIFGTHPNNVVPYVNLYTGAAYGLSGKTPEQIHAILLEAKRCIDDMRNPYNGDYMWCEEPCADIYVSKKLLRELVHTLKLQQYGKVDGCCSTIQPCNSLYNQPLLLDSGMVSPFAYYGEGFKFVECEMLDQVKLDLAKSKDSTAGTNIFNSAEMLDVDLDKAWLMVFSTRIAQYKLMQKHFREIPGQFRTERREMERYEAMATDGSGWFDIISGAGMILYTGK